MSTVPELGAADQSAFDVRLPSLADEDVLRDVAVSRALVTCDDGNVASAATIERCGGELENIVEPAISAPKRRYWIDIG